MEELEKCEAGAEDSFDSMQFLNDVDSPNSSSSSFEEDDEPKQKKQKFEPSDELLLLATEQLKKRSESLCQQLATAWGQQLNEMERHQRLIAQKLINDIVFNGAMGLLNMNTRLTNLSPISMPTERSAMPSSGRNFAVFCRESSHGGVQVTPSSTPTPTMNRPTTPTTIVINRTLQEAPGNAESKATTPSSSFQQNM